MRYTPLCFYLLACLELRRLESGTVISVIQEHLPTSRCDQLFQLFACHLHVEQKGGDCKKKWFIHIYIVLCVCRQYIPATVDIKRPYKYNPLIILTSALISCNQHLNKSAGHQKRWLIGEHFFSDMGWTMDGTSDYHWVLFLVAQDCYILTLEYLLLIN